MKLIIQGPPRTKKTAQRIIVNRRTGRPMIIPSKLSKDWEKMAIEELREQYHDYCQLAADPINEPVHVMALFYREARRGDLTGYKQALADALERSGVIKNDSLIESWDGSRKLLDKDNPRVEVTITPMEDAGE